MKSYKIISALALAALALAACTPKAHIKGTVAGAGEKEVIVKLLNINSYNVLDTVRTSASGSFSYDVEVKKGDPEFIYLFYGDTRIAGLLLEAGETVKVEADTLGKYSVSGSEGSEKLAEVDASYSKFIQDVINAETSQDATKLYINYYREALKYVMNNPTSLTTIPVLFQKLYDNVPVFLNSTDALVFRTIADTLKTVYPDSRYVKSLEREAKVRENDMLIDRKLQGAPELGYPEITLPDIKGQKVSLSSVVESNKVVLVHFWTSSDPTHSLMNIEQLLPVYKEYHSRGFEIFSVCLDSDKTQWGTVVNSQKLPWINVNDGQGAYSSSAIQYNVTSIPASFILSDGELRTSGKINGADGLRKELDKWLRQ